MTAAETLAVLKLLQAAQPGAYLDERTPDVWANACASVDPDVGLVAAQRLIAEWSERRFPSPADFLTWVRAVKREREPLALPVSTDVPLEGDEARAQIAAARQALAAARRKK